MTASRFGRGWIEVATAVLLFACGGQLDRGGETDRNTNWLEHCEEGDRDCMPIVPPEIDDERRAPGSETDVDPPSPDEPGSDSEFSTVDSCVVRCDLVLSGDECRGTAELPSLRQTLQTWQSADCSSGPLLEGYCSGGTRFVWRGGDASEVRYFSPDGGFIGLSSFLSIPDPSTCNGVRRWPQQVACAAPTVTRELCADRASAQGGSPIDVGSWFESGGDLY